MASRGKPIKNPHTFHSPLYRDLLMNVIPLRKEYRRVPDMDGRKEMAKQEFDYWHGYLLARKEEIKALEEKRRIIEEDVDSVE